MTMPDGEQMMAARAGETMPEEETEAVEVAHEDSAGNGTAMDAVTDSRWSKIQAMFVDDPRSAVAEAAVLADEAVGAFIATVREQQASLASSWQAEDADTERLRTAFREYRTFWNGVTGLSQSA